MRLVEPDAVGEVVRLADNDEQDVRCSPPRPRGLGPPAAEVDHDLATGAENVVHVQAVARSLDGYRCETVHAVAADGVDVPISLVTRGERRGRPMPALRLRRLRVEPGPRVLAGVLPLLDRGVTFAVAHVRGGGELGRHWWQQGRLLRKRRRSPTS